MPIATASAIPEVSTGLLINFNVPILKDGIIRRVL